MVTISSGPSLRTRSWLNRPIAPSVSSANRQWHAQRGRWSNIKNSRLCPGLSSKHRNTTRSRRIEVLPVRLLPRNTDLNVCSSNRMPASTICLSTGKLLGSVYIASRSSSAKCSELFWLSKIIGSSVLCSNNAVERDACSATPCGLRFTSAPHCGRWAALKRLAILEVRGW